MDWQLGGDALLLVLLIIVVVLVVLVIRIRREITKLGDCKCPVDEEWVKEFNKWKDNNDAWAESTNNWAKVITDCINSANICNGGGVNPPSPPPCKFGSC